MMVQKGEGKQKVNKDMIVLNADGVHLQQTQHCE